MAMMDSSQGRPAVSPPIVFGAMIIKHIEKLDDRGVILTIQENIYMQYFMGLKEFTVNPVFDPSLFVKIPKRVGRKMFDSLNADLIRMEARGGITAKYGDRLIFDTTFVTTKRKTPENQRFQGFLSRLYV